MDRLEVVESKRREVVTHYGTQAPRPASHPC